MDHLPSVKDPYRPIHIRYLPSICYDKRGFDDFPERYGWTSEKLQSAHANTSPLRRDAAAFLQSWLYFGTISEVIGIPMWISDFVRHDRRRLWITTKRLPMYIQDWADSIASGSEAEERARLRNAKNCFFSVSNYVNDLADRQPVHGTSRIMTPEHALAITVLLFTLNHNMPNVFKRSSESTHPGYHFNMEPCFLRLLRSRFTTSCPSLVHRLEKRLHFTGLYYASLLATPPSFATHRECTEKDCVAEKIDTRTYSTAHSGSECNCEHVHIDWPRLIAGGFLDCIPLISLEDTPNSLHLKVVPFKNPAETPYVAISHVWSHGLGNIQANSLPECQLRVLHRRVIKSHPRQLQYFWIDTLCIPLEPPEARNKAIVKMKDIYRRSELVLVLDAELVLSSMHCEIEEILMRINRSRWLTRLWTFQEAVSAQKLVFQFSEGSVDTDSLFAEAQEISSGGMLDRMDILFQAIEFYLCFRRLRSSVTRAEKIGLLCRDVAWRSTSRIEDESICYASILDMDLQTLLDTTGHHRMQLFWLLQEQIPLAILFEPGQRLQTDGFRWAHSSLLDTRMDNDYDVVIDDNRASVTRQGLMVDCFGYFLSMSDKAITKQNYVRFKDKREDKWYDMIDDDDMTLDDLHKAIALSLDSPVLILKNELNDLKYIDGILAVFRKQESDTLFVRYICRVSVQKVDSYADRWSGNTILTSQVRESDAVGDPTEGKKRWCIS